MRKTVFSCTVPIGSPDMNFRYATLADKHKFDQIWFPDHILTIHPHIVCPDIWAIISALSIKTKNAKLATGVSDPIRRNPTILAQTVATVDQITGGRAILGIGAGEDMNLKPFGFSRPQRASERRQMLREAVHVIRKLWVANVENPANYEGRYFKLKNAYLSIYPKQKLPPIYIGATGPKTRELVGEIGDGFYPPLVSAELFPKFLEDVKKGLKRAGRNIDEIDCVAKLPATAVSDDPEKARSQVIDRARLFLIYDSAALKTMGYDIQVEGSVGTMTSGRETVEYVEELKSQIPEKAAESISIFGTVDDCIGQVERFLKVGATQINIRPMSEETIAKFDDVIEYFKKSNR